MYFTGILTAIVIAVSHFITGFYLFQPWIEPFTDLKFIMLYGALPRIMQYLCCTIMLHLLCKRFISFLDGFNKVMQGDRQAASGEDFGGNTKELDKILNLLTEREKDVFGLLVQGNTNAQIAQLLCLSNGTVKNYVSVVFEKVGTKDRTALVMKYSPYSRSHDLSHS